MARKSLKNTLTGKIRNRDADVYMRVLDLILAYSDCRR